MKKVTRNALALLITILLLGAAVLWIWPEGRPENIRGMETNMHHTSMESMIRNAKTSEDHEALAQHYESAAQHLDADASRQEHLATLYATSIGGRRPLQSLATHCSNVAKNLRAAAAEDRELARLHRELKESVGGRPAVEPH